uniref:RanBD1 domain-containing protein n=1 Tax=Pseudo-nitzschia australis TaxID=44445 RepID=A0A7S4EH26_9STRA|mmetsp:Transcript_2769/g.5947  ORF Transcript_2769/g.5947 Transcript_2769/m.5947 type:complete len:507 (-) Transcript_2769:382-1902(-)|eukprot:CAMPEP_0168187010 /NCGR_PEP_ID=MMETSP0139_2-20121125/14774_1 /TAXON_ID=44445 /ORGANISM="Pseudo-nitzschia australis, Strain 10249 10 AB" /LENGTH=506 /DNA_ID=CAMNT_0008109129 /DNA_START=199 /DNA_END=1719 /DNA_ORIENTATION=+
MANEDSTESAQENISEQDQQQQQQEPPAKKKRGADNQITKDEYDDDSDGDGDGDERLKQGFKKASEETLKKRKIYKVKRPLSVPTGAPTNGTSTASATEDKPVAKSGDAASSTTSSNPFASTNLSATSTSTSATSTSNPFASATLTAANPFASTSLTATATESKTTTEENNTRPAEKRVFGFGAASGTNGNSGFGSGTVGGFAGVSGGFGSSSSTSGFGTSSLTGASGSKTSTLGLGGFGSASSSAAAATTTSGSSTKSLFGTTGASSISFNFSSKMDSAAAAGGKGNENPANLPDTVELKTGEEDEEAIHSGRCKAFEWVEVAENDAGDTAENETVQDGASPSNSAKNPSVQSSTQFQTAISTSEEKKDPSKKEGASSHDEDKWRELGIGPVKLLRSKSKHKRLRLVQRRESSKMGPATKVILNASLWKESTCDRDRQAQQYLHLKTIKDGKMCQYLLKFKEVHDAGLFHHHVMDQIPLARPCFVHNEENTTAAKGTAAVEGKKD